jgi:hypothetical protein
MKRPDPDPVTVSYSGSNQIRIHKTEFRRVAEISTSTAIGLEIEKMGIKSQFSNQATKDNRNNDHRSNLVGR